MDAVTYRQRLAHLTALWAFGVTQPLFSLLLANPEFLAIRGLTRVDIVVFALGVALIPPVVAMALEWLVGRLSRWLANVLHVLVLFLFLLAIGLQAADSLAFESIVASLLVVWGVALAGAAVYLAFHWSRMFLAYSLVLPAAGLLWFVIGAPVVGDAEAATARPATRPPIVFLVFDELPLASLLTSRGEIDAVRYPSFARLAAGGTWYRNATTVHDHTTLAVPAMLTGRRPSPGSLPTVGEHPDNLFTLLGASYELDVLETATSLCPTDLCPDDDPFLVDGHLYRDAAFAYLRRVVPESLSAPVPLAFEEFDEVAFERFVDRLVTRAAPGRLHLAHLMLPHAPWTYLPSGRTYAQAGRIEGLSGVWDEGPGLFAQEYQRHLLQVAYADSVLGRVLDALEASGTFEEAMVIVAADHGLSLGPAGRNRFVDRENAAEIAPVPMIVKYPRQREGRRDVRNAFTIDLYPTIADVLGLARDVEIEGRSLLSAPRSSREVVVDGTKTATVRVLVSTLRDDLQRVVRRKVALLGEGTDSLYRVGKHVSLLGSRAPDAVSWSHSVRVRIADEDALENVQLSSSFVPGAIVGFVEAGRIPARAELAVAVNGVFRGLTRCPRCTVDERFYVLVPEESFRSGSNRVDVYLIEGRDRLVLTWIGTSADLR